MMSRKKLLLFIGISCFLFLLVSCQPSDPPIGQPLAISQQVKTDLYKSFNPNTVEWEDLIPEGYVFETQESYTSMNVAEAVAISDRLLETTPVVESMDKQDIRLAGYVVPLEYSDEAISEFLLVPLEGACVHIPAPPANQILFVKPQYPLPIEDSFDVLNVVGTMQLDGMASSLAVASYRMENALLEPYIETDSTKAFTTVAGTHLERGR